MLSTDNQFMNDFHNFVVVVDDDVLTDFHYINRIFLILAGFGMVYQIHIFFASYLPASCCNFADRIY